jgi:hypothetical protein
MIEESFYPFKSVARTTKKKLVPLVFSTKILFYINYKTNFPSIKFIITKINHNKKIKKTPLSTSLRNFDFKNN